MRVRFIAMKFDRGILPLPACLLLGILAGCHGAAPVASSDPPVKKSDSIVIQAGHIEQAPAATFKGADDLAAAEEFYRQKEFKKAEKLFAKVADDTSNPPLHAEKARFFEAECQRVRGEHPDAMHTYNRLLIDFQYGVFREQAVARMFEIADFWLEDTRAQLAAEKEKAEGKRWFTPWNFVHFEKGKPLIDEEGHALKMMEQVYYNDPTGPFAEKALFMAGYINFQRGNFREADQLLTQLIEISDKNGKKSEFRDRAIELAILAKNNSTGGPLYDGRKVAESLKLIQQAKATSPELVTKRGEFLDNQVNMIRYMQAEKDYNIAEFYRNTGHPASAWFYYELVRRRYPNTEFQDKAIVKMKEMHGDLLAQQQQSEFTKATRRQWNKLVLGHDTPTLGTGQELPSTPSLPAQRDDQITPVGNKQLVPKEIMPRQ